MKSTKLSSQFSLIVGVLIIAALCFPKPNAHSEPSVTAPEIYVVDSQRRPGKFIEIRPGTTSAPRSLTHTRRETNPAVTAIAFYRQSEAFFVPANSRSIMKTNGLEMQPVYEHSTYIRDIAFDSDGNLFFSEASGAGRDGSIYLLGYLGSYEEAGAPWRTIDLDEVGGFWAGHFAFDPSNKLFISTGNRVPAEIHELATGGFVRRYTFNEPIAGFAFQSERRLLFANYRKTVYALEGFATRSAAYSNPEAERLSDVEIINDYQGTTCSLSGRLLGGAELWNQTSVNVFGPGVFWRDATPSNARVASNGSYTFENLSPGDYWLVADIRGDTARSFETSPLAVVCPSGRRITNQNLHFE